MDFCREATFATAYLLFEVSPLPNMAFNHWLGVQEKEEKNEGLF
jgi:hypothetical protein